MRKYVLSEEEIRSLLSGIVQIGPKETYEKMKERMLAAREHEGMQDVDEMCMDMYDSMLIRARSFGCDDDDKEGQDIRATLFQIASMLRTLAHELHRTCYKNKPINTKRFLELVSHNQGNYTFQSKCGYLNDCCYAYIH
jgi:hypothetical protein